MIIRIFTPEPEMEIRYKVFLDASKDKLRFITCEEADAHRGLR